MTLRGRIVSVLLILAGAWVVVSPASAHAYLIKTVPAASGVLNGPPPSVALTYDEAVEPSFAIVSVTNAEGHQETTGTVTRSPANPDTLVVALRPDLPEGWYLVYWRAISVDGHPVQGAYTYAVGPNPGPAPRFAVPSIAGSATSPQVVISRWVLFLIVMTAIGLFAFRFGVARMLPHRLDGVSLRRVSRAFVISSAIGVIAVFVYLDIVTSVDSLRSVFAVSALVPLFRVTAFGRGYVDMALCFAVFCAAGWIALYLDDPSRGRRSLAAIISQTGAGLAAAAVLIIPGASGHAAQTSPRGVSLLADWLHLASGSLWIGGLVGVLVLWFSLPADHRVRGLSLVIPRFSNLALASVIVLFASGTVATINHMPALNALWDTGYGVAILIKAGLLAAAIALASVNLLRTRPGLAAAQTAPERGPAAATLLGRLVGGETVLVGAAVFVAAVLSSLAPPPPAFALQNAALANVGPGRVAQTVRRAGDQLQVLVAPNRAAAPNVFALRITRNGLPVRHANVTLAFNHLEMQMPQQQYQLTETRPGVYSRSAPALIMVGKWSLAFNVAPATGRPFTAVIVDEANG